MWAKICNIAKDQSPLSLKPNIHYSRMVVSPPGPSGSSAGTPSSRWPFYHHINQTRWPRVRRSGLRVREAGWRWPGRCAGHTGTARVARRTRAPCCRRRWSAKIRLLRALVWVWYAVHEELVVGSGEITGSPVGWSAFSCTPTLWHVTLPISDADSCAKIIDKAIVSFSSELRPTTWSSSRHKYILSLAFLPCRHYMVRSLSQREQAIYIPLWMNIEVEVRSYPIESGLLLVGICVIVLHAQVWIEVVSLDTKSASSWRCRTPSEQASCVAQQSRYQ